MENLNQALDLFLNNKTGTVKLSTNFVLAAVENALILREFSPRSGIQQHVLAFKTPNGQKIGNSSRLRATEYDNQKEMPEAQVLSFQTRLSEALPMIPFVVMKEANLSLSTFEELDRTPDETVKIKHYASYLSQSEFDKLKNNPKFEVIDFDKQETYTKDTFRYDVNYFELRHFTGARLFRTSNKVFLMDIDRQEIKHGIFNPFLVEIPDQSVESISEAYESLKPTLVKEAEANGIEVLRQGEWFLIRNDSLVSVSPIETREGFLRVGRNRPNRATKYFNVEDRHFVSGVLSHTGREHKDLELTAWYQAIPNTSANSFRISGDID